MIPIGFLIGLNPGADYSSEDYIWVNQKYHSFVYVDRIVIDEKNIETRELVRFFMTTLKPHLEARSKISCEKVNLIPKNKESMNFHKNMDLRK